MASIQQKGREGGHVHCEVRRWILSGSEADGWKGNTAKASLHH